MKGVSAAYVGVVERIENIVKIRVNRVEVFAYGMVVTPRGLGNGVTR